MNNFNISKWLRLTSSGPVTTSGSDDLVHLRQGDMDGACGPYCLYMALIAMGFIVRSDATDLSRHDGRTREGRLRDAIKLFGTLSSNGTTDLELQWLADHFRTQKLHTEALFGDNKKGFVAAAVKAIDDGGLPIIGLRWSKTFGGGGHWVLVVGYEWCDIGTANGNVKIQPTRLLCLDPGSPTPGIHGWNAVLDVYDEEGKAIHQGSLPLEHWSATGEVTKCQIDGGVVLSRLN